MLILLFALLMHGEQKKNYKYILVATIMLFCVYGLRDAETIGNDSSTTYRNQFTVTNKEREWADLPRLSSWWAGEAETSNHVGHERNSGLRWTMKIIGNLTDGDYQWFIAIISAFVMIAVSWLIAKYSPSPIQSYLYFLGLLYYTMMFNVLKQSIAIALVLFSFRSIVDKKPIRFFFLVLFASVFHFPALVFLPAYFIGNMKIDRTYLIFLAILFAVTYLLRDRLLDAMTDTYDTVVNNNSNRFLANKVLVMLLIISAGLVIRPPDSEDRVYSTLLALMGVAAVIQTFSSYNNTFERLADYYFQFAIVFIPMFVEDVKTKRLHLSSSELRLVRRAGPYLFCSFAIWRFLDSTLGDPTLFPYQFYFQAEEAKELFVNFLL